MKNYEKYHLWLGCFNSIEEYEKYVGIDKDAGTSSLAMDLGMPFKDSEMDEVGKLTCLQPDLRYTFPVEELLFDTPVLKKDLPRINEIYGTLSAKAANSYIYYFDIKLKFDLGERLGCFYYIGFFDADKSFVED